MPNYKQLDTTVSSWVRAKTITIINSDDPGMPPTISFSEEKVMEVNGVKSKVGFGSEERDVTINGVPEKRRFERNIWEKFTPENATNSFDLLNPLDDSVIGSAQYQDVYVMLYSIYKFLANRRDTEILAEIATLETPPE